MSDNLCRNNLHELRGPADYHGKECDKCYWARQRAYDDRRKLAMAILQAAESRGISGDRALEIFKTTSADSLARLAIPVVTPRERKDVQC